MINDGKVIEAELVDELSPTTPKNGIRKPRKIKKSKKRLREIGKNT